MYAIRITKTNRYITYCDDCWYEASATPIYMFTKEQAEKIANTMKNHYVYEMEIFNAEGDSFIINHLRKKTNPMVEATTKKSLFKISTKKRYE